ncbi:MAG: hypothetical protein V4577_04510 [Bacteroidota bacterium]
MLFLTNDTKTAFPSKCDQPLGYAFDQDHLWNFENVRQQLSGRCLAKQDPAFDRQVLDYLYYGINLFQELSKRKYSEFPLAIEASDLLMSSIPLPVFTGTYWGLNRDAFTGVYVNRREENVLLAALLHTEQQLALAGTPGPGVQPRIWQEVHTGRSDTQSIIKELRETMLPGNKVTASLAGILVHINPDPGQQPAAYYELVRQWCHFIRQYRSEQEILSPAMLFNLQLQGLSNWHHEDILLFHSLVCTESLDEQATVLLSRTKKETGKPTGLFSRWQFPSRLLPEEQQADLKPLFLMLFFLGDHVPDQTNPAIFFERAPDIARICAAHQAQFIRHYGLYQAEREEVHAHTVLDVVHHYLTSETEFISVLEQLLLLHDRYVPGDATARFIRTCSGSLYPPARYTAFKFSMTHSGNTYLDSWVQAADEHQQPPVYQTIQPEKILLSLFKAYTDLAEGQTRQRENLAAHISHYLEQLPPGHCFPAFFDLLAAPGMDPQAYFAWLGKLSHLQALQFVRSGINARFHFPVSGLIRHILLQREPGLFWKTFFFSQQLDLRDTRDLLAESDPLIRGIAGLCTRLQLRTAPYSRLSAQIKSCRTLKPS